MRWKRVIGYGLILWALPFALSVVLFGVRENNRPLFESLITVVGVVTAIVAALHYFRDDASPELQTGVAAGFAWMAISIIVDLPIFLGAFQMSPSDYAADIALTYLAFPAITTGIAVAQRRGSGVD